jgi:ABC transporter substrate binding protein
MAGGSLAERRDAHQSRAARTGHPHQRRPQRNWREPCRQAGSGEKWKTSAGSTAKASLPKAGTANQSISFEPPLLTWCGSRSTCWSFRPPVWRSFSSLETKTIPIVVTGAGADLVAVGLVANLARPGGNLTGVQILNADLIPKQFELLRALVRPSARSGRARAACTSGGNTCPCKALCTWADVARPSKTRRSPIRRMAPGRAGLPLLFSAVSPDGSNPIADI